MKQDFRRKYELIFVVLVYFNFNFRMRTMTYRNFILTIHIAKRHRQKGHTNKRLVLHNSFLFT